MYHSHDLNWAAYLVVSGHPLTDAQRDNGRVSFAFEDIEPGRLDDLRRSWVSGSGMVSAKRYSEALKELKGLCFTV